MSRHTEQLDASGKRITVTYYMTISVRLPRAKQAALARLAKTRGCSKSDLVRDAIDLLIDGAPKAQGAGTAYELLAPQIGRGDSGGRAALSEHTGRRFTELVREKALVRRHAR
jgi:predicted DNA-binding protein